MTYATVSAVSAAALLGGLVDLDVLDNEVASVKTLGIGVGLSVLEETEKELGGLGGPAGAGNTELLAYMTKKRSAPCLLCPPFDCGFVSVGRGSIMLTMPPYSPATLSSPLSSSSSHDVPVRVCLCM